MSLYGLLVVAGVGVGIAFLLTAIDSAFSGDMGGTVFWAFLSGASFLFAYWLVKD